MQPIYTANPGDKAKLRRHLKKAGQLDPELNQLIERIGYPEPRSRSADFATLLQVITSQQLSTKVAAVIFGRVVRLCNGNVTYRKILNRSDQQLRDCGLSARKVEYAKSLAQAVKNKSLVIESLPSMSTDEVVATLSALRGFGRWSGEIFAMFALGHQDVYPADDLALQVAIQRYKNLSERPNAKLTREFSEVWSPYRTAVSLLMWKFYGAATLD